MKTQYKKASTLGTVALGLLTAAVASGCGSDASSTNPITADNAAGNIPVAAAITARNFAANGCEVTGTFDIVSPSVINFVAFDKSTFDKTASSSSENSSNFQLSAIDDLGISTAITKTAQEADSSMQAMFNTATNNTSTATALSKQLAQQESQNSAAATTTLEEQATTTVTNNSESQATIDTKATHDSSSEASQFSTAAAKSANLTAAENTNVAAEASKTAAEQKSTAASSESFFPFVPIAGVAFTSSSFFAAANAAKAAQSAFAFNANAASAKSLSDTFTFQASQQEAQNHTADTTHVATEQEAHNSSTVSTEKSLKSATTAKNNSENQVFNSLETAQNAQQTASAKTDQSAQNHTNASTFVFNSLSTFNSHHFVLVVKMTASQAQELLRIFQGTSSEVSSFSDFPISTPACN